MITEFNGIKPNIHEDTFVAPGAQVIGDVELCENASVWHNAVLRGDIAKITLGKGSNVQDNCTLHCDFGKELKIGGNVTVGHNAVLHSCTVGDGSLVGMGAIVLNDAVIGKDCLIAAGALVTPGTVIPDGALARGSPAKVKRELSAEEIEANHKNSEEYVNLSKIFKQQNK